MNNTSKGKQKKFISDFIKKHDLAVIATVDSKGNPEAAVVEFSETDNSELIFDTFSYFRKYENLLKNPKVAVVIGWDENITVQYEGTAIEIKGKELEACKKIHLEKLPDAQKYVKSKDIKFFKITPKWIMYSDLNKKPWKIIEINF